MIVKKLSTVIIFASAFCFLFLLGIADIHGNDNMWKAGTARTIITPEQPLWLAGYYARKSPAEGKLHDIWAKALALEDAKGNKAVLVTADLIGFPKGMSDRIRDRIEDKFGLSRAQVILSSSHTHSGPGLTGGLVEVYPLANEEFEKIREYSGRLEDMIVDLVGDALNSLQPAELFSENGVVRFQVNRRNNSESSLTAQTDLNGPNDYAVPVLKVVKGSGDIMAVVFGYACHPTVLNLNLWSGDYPGFAQLEIEKMYPGATAMFFQGAGADQNPVPRRTVSLARQYGLELAAAVDRVLNEEMKKLSPDFSVAYRDIQLELTTPPTKNELVKMAEEFSLSDIRRELWALDMIRKIDNGESLPVTYPYPVQVWNIGGQTLVSLGGELLIDYSVSLKRILGQDIFVMGYANDVMAYIPPVRVLREGGYESEQSQRYTYGLPGAWKSNIETIIIKGVLDLAEETGVPVL